MLIKGSTGGCLGVFVEILRISCISWGVTGGTVRLCGAMLVGTSGCLGSLWGHGALLGGLVGPPISPEGGVLAPGEEP